MNWGIIEPYNSGLVEIIPEGEGFDECSDNWALLSHYCLIVKLDILPTYW